MNTSKSKQEDRTVVWNSTTTSKIKTSTIKPRVKQKAFKNEEIPIWKIRKDYEKYKIRPKT